MLIWVIAISLFVVFGAIGYGKGAIRMIFPLLGIFVGAMCAIPLSPMFNSVVPLFKIQNRAINWLLPPVLVFLSFGIIFVSVGFAVHYFVFQHFKYKTDEYTQLAFQRLNRRLGICVGLFAGGAYTILLSVVIYFLGYLTAQMASGDNDVAVIRYLNQARADLHSSGLDKAAAVFDPMPEAYYQASDVLGVIYNNPAVHSRLSNYPPFLGMAERQEFTDIASDTAYQEMLASKQNINAIVENPKTQAILNNQEILAELKALDLKDLKTYLETGKSTKFDDEKILGRWEVDVPAVIAQARIKYPVFSTNSFAMAQLKKFASTYLPGISMVAATDNKVFVKNSAPAAAAPDPNAPADPNAAQAAPAPAAAPVPRAAVGQPPRPTNPNQVDTRLLQRYGLKRGPAAPQARPTAPVAVAAGVRPAPAAAGPAPIVVPLPANLKLSGQGTWKKEDDGYTLTIATEGGKEAKLQAKIESDRLFLTIEKGPTLVFVKI